MDLDTTNWSGEGTFTQTLIDTFHGLDEVASLRVEDAPSSRSEHMNGLVRLLVVPLVHWFEDFNGCGHERYDVRHARLIALGGQPP